MIDIKHANIGATVSLVLNAHKLSSSEELPEMVAELFTLEAVGCSHQLTTNSDPLCKYIEGEFVSCSVGNCPLGKIVDDIAAKRAIPTITEHIKKRGVFGEDPDNNTLPTHGGSWHLGYTGWRKYWNNLKKLVNGG